MSAVKTSFLSVSERGSMLRRTILLLGRILFHRVMEGWGGVRSNEAACQTRVSERGDLCCVRIEATCRGASARGGARRAEAACQTRGDVRCIRVETTCLSPSARGGVRHALLPLGRILLHPIFMRRGWSHVPRLTVLLLSRGGILDCICERGYIHRMQVFRDLQSVLSSHGWD